MPAQYSPLVAIQQAAAMWDVQPAILKGALSSRTVQTRNSTYTSPNNRIQAIGARDSLCANLYTRVFDYLIHKTNIALQKYGSQKAVVIGVLDIYGFEIFTVCYSFCLKSNMKQEKWIRAILHQLC